MIWHHCLREKKIIQPIMPRTMLSKLLCNEPAVLMQQNGCINNKKAHYLTVEGILYQMRTGYPWRNLPDEFGK